jgi:uncharacterized membrane protein
MPSKEERTISSRRLEAFTDGVFAIAATLLVLDLSVDALGKSIHTDSALWAALGSMADNVISFVISFLILGTLWSIHVWQFEYVHKVTHMLVFLNTLRLLGVVLVPFTTSLNGTYSSLMAGRILLPLNFLFVTLVGAIQWFYATSPRTGLVSGLAADEVRSTRVGSLASVISSVVVVCLAPFFGPWAFFAFFLNYAADGVAGLSKPKAAARERRARDAE